MKNAKKIGLLLLSIMIIVSCTQETPEQNDVLIPEETTETTTIETLQADFTPPTGKGDHTGTEGPWARRLMSAYSNDGLTWVKTNTVISDQADVGDLTMDENGRLYLYYYGWTVGEKQNLPAMAISDDHGTTWTFKNMKFEGFPNRKDVSDPNVNYENGIFQLYGSTRANNQTYLLHGESTDGITFTYKNIAFQPETKNAGVAAVYKTETEWHLLSLGSLGFNNDVEPGTTWYATSQNGDLFTLKDTLLFSDSENGFFHGNVIPVENGYRLYVFSDASNTIKSFFSEDGETWTIEEGIRLTLDTTSGLESEFVGDTDVIQLSDGRYFMVYSTLIP